MSGPVYYACIKRLDLKLIVDHHDQKVIELFSDSWPGEDSRKYERVDQAMIDRLAGKLERIVPNPEIESRKVSRSVLFYYRLRDLL